MFQPLLIVVEDLDSCGLKEKNALTGTFLECIDDIDKSLNFVLVYSANDTSLINPTIINRPGRSDAVIEIFPPKTIKEAAEVITYRLNYSKDKFEKEFKLEFNEKDLRNVAKRCVKEKFTQAEITNAIVEQALINIGLNVDKDTQTVIKGKQLSKYLSEAVKTQIQTRSAIKNCNFKNQDPNDYKDITDDVICESRQDSVLTSHCP
jgi:SpoVK/Ycf46/Vps4 family AAA+-type ATPase